MFRLIAVIVMVSAAVGGVNAEEELYLRYVLPDAKQLLYEVKASSSLQTLGAKLRQEWKSREIIESGGDGSQKIRVMMEDMFESEPASGGIIQRDILSQLVGNEISFTLTERGDISEMRVDGFDRLPLRERQAKQIILVQLRQLYAAAFPQLPAGEAGDGWDATRHLKVTDGDFELDDTFTSTFKVKKKKKKDGFLCLEVEEKTQIEMKGYMAFGQGKENRLLTYRTVGTGSRQGKFLFDTDRGLILEYKGKAKFKLKFGPVGQPEAAMQESNARVKFERKLKDIQDL